VSKHRHPRGSWVVHQPGAKSVSYPTRSRAQRAAKQLKGGRVTPAGPPCLLTLLCLPVYAPWALLRRCWR
jgi:hypothetical protein